MEYTMTKNRGKGKCFQCSSTENILQVPMGTGWKKPLCRKCRNIEYTKRDPFGREKRISKREVNNDPGDLWKYMSLTFRGKSPSAWG